MKPTSATSGYAGYSKHRRLAIWQAAHKQLLNTNVQYRKRFHSYLAAVVFLSCILAVFYLPFFGVPLFAPVADVVIILGLAIVVVGLTLRQLHYQWKSIRDCVWKPPVQNRAGTSTRT